MEESPKQSLENSRYGNGAEAGMRWWLGMEMGQWSFPATRLQEGSTRVKHIMRVGVGSEGFGELYISILHDQMASTFYLCSFA